MKLRNAKMINYNGYPFHDSKYERQFVSRHYIYDFSIQKSFTQFTSISETEVKRNIEKWFTNLKPPCLER